MARKSHDSQKDSSLRNNIPFLTIISGQILNNFLRLYHKHICGSPTKDILIEGGFDSLGGLKKSCWTIM